MATDRGIPREQRAITEGAAVYAADGDQLGTVKEVRGQYFKVDAPMRPDYWLPFAVVHAAVGGELQLGFDKDRLGEYTVTAPDAATTAPNTTPDTATSTATSTRTDALAATDTDSYSDTDIDSAHRQPSTAREGDQTEWARPTAHELELREEELRVATQRQAAGEVRLRKEVAEETTVLEVPVRREVLLIEHVTGTGKVLVGDRELAAGETLQLTLYEERVTANKEVVVAEDVTVRTAEVQHTEQLQGTVRKEQLVVDDPQGRVVGDGGTDGRDGRERRAETGLPTAGT